MIVAQHGSRHRYALPRLLESAGMLEAFYTDSTAYSPLGACASLFSFIGRCVSLADRRVEGVPGNKVFSTDAVLVSDLLHRSKSGQPFRDYQRRHAVLSRRMCQWGTKGANWVYCMYDEDQDFMKFARERGLRCAVDVFVNPLTPRIMLEEQARFHDFPTQRADSGLVEEMERYVTTSLRLADLLTCPSEWVAEGVRTLVPEAAPRIRIVPYGSSFESREANTPVPGRVLFAGHDFLRKGLPYLGMAATILRGRGRTYDFRIAGPASGQVVSHRLCRELHFLGKLASVEMKQEFASADVFALPTLSEGFASVIIEAMSQGVPVITTPCAGSQITSSVDGMLVPARDAEALADAVERVVEQRALRRSLAANAAHYSGRNYTLRAWSQRLASAFGVESHA